MFFYECITECGNKTGTIDLGIYKKVVKNINIIVCKMTIKKNEGYSYTSNGIKTFYTYNADGLRNAKTTGNEITGYYYDEDNVIIDTLNGNFNARNIWEINPIARQKDGATFYYLYNGYADVVALVDAAGNDLNSHDYGEYGNIKESNESVTDNPNKYAGQYYDNESGLYYLRARYYDPELMRFISEDENKGDVKDPLSLNLYVYCEGNPARYNDLDGHEKICAMSDLILNGGGGDLITVVYLISQFWQEYLTNGVHNKYFYKVLIKLLQREIE